MRAPQWRRVVLINITSETRGQRSSHTELRFNWNTNSCYRGSSLGMEELFQSIGLSESKARDTLKNANVSNALKSYILQVHTEAVDMHVLIAPLHEQC